MSTWVIINLWLMTALLVYALIRVEGVLRDVLKHVARIRHIVEWGREQ